MKCLNCGRELHDDERYCPNCGQSAKTTKLRFLPGIREMLEILFNLDNTFLRTATGLLKRPGRLIVEYIEGRRVIYFKPFALLFVLATFYFVTFKLCFGHTPGIMGTQEDNISGLEAKLGDMPTLCYIVSSLFEIFHNKAWVALLSITVTLFPLKLLFSIGRQEQRYSLAEYFYAMTYVQALSILVEMILFPIGFYSLDIMESIASPTTFFYSIFALKQMHGYGWWRTLFLYLLQCLLVILFFAIIIILAVIVIKQFFPEFINR